MISSSDSVSVKGSQSDDSSFHIDHVSINGKKRRSEPRKDEVTVGVISRREKNRLSAQASRDKQKAYIGQLESTNVELKKTNEEQAKTIRELYRMLEEKNETSLRREEALRREVAEVRSEVALVRRYIDQIPRLWVIHDLFHSITDVVSIICSPINQLALRLDLIAPESDS